MKNKRIMHLLLNAALTLTPAIKGQPINQPQLPTAGKGTALSDAVDLRPVLVPGMTIAGHTFTKETTITNAAINDVEEIAFMALLDEKTANAAVFTSKRIVAQQGDVFDGKTLMNIRFDSRIAINRAGQVMYQAYFGDTAEIAAGGEYSGLGLFVDNHLAMRLTAANENDAFSLSDDGQVAPMRESPPASAGIPPAQKKPGLLDRVRISPLRLPKGPTVEIGPDSNRPPVRYGARPALVDDPLSLLHPNRLGQILIPANIPGQGFILLLGTPIKR
jgi:hypothetical protein